MVDVSNNSSKKGFFYIFLGIFFWSTIEIVYKLIQNEVDALNANFWRMFFGGFVLLLYSATLKNSKKALKDQNDIIKEGSKGFIFFIKRYYLYYINASLVGLVVGQIIYLQGTKMTEAAYSATIFSANPIILSLLTIIFFKENKNLIKILGIIIGFIGVVFVITDFQFNNFFNSANIIGNFLVFIGMSLWCIDVFLGKAIMNKAEKDNVVSGYESEYFNAVTFILAAMIMLPFIIRLEGFDKMLNYSASAWLGLIYLGVVTGGIGYVLFFKGINMMEVSKGINIFYFKPIIASILSYFIFPSVHLKISLFLGILIEMLSLIMVSNNGSSKRSESLDDSSRKKIRES
ncbi:MAG: DMT family transporter [Promethearchaeota archaeon]